MIYGSIRRSVLARFRMMENIFTMSALPLYILTFHPSKKLILMNPTPRYTLSIAAYSLTILTPNIVRWSMCVSVNTVRETKLIRRTRGTHKINTTSRMRQIHQESRQYLTKASGYKMKKAVQKPE